MLRQQKAFALAQRSSEEGQTRETGAEAVGQTRETEAEAVGQTREEYEGDKRVSEAGLKLLKKYGKNLGKGEGFGMNQDELDYLTLLAENEARYHSQSYVTREQKKNRRDLATKVVTGKATADDFKRAAKREAYLGSHLGGRVPGFIKKPATKFALRDEGGVVKKAHRARQRENRALRKAAKRGRVTKETAKAAASKAAPYSVLWRAFM